MEGWLVDYDLGRIQKEAVVVWFKAIEWHLPGAASNT
jgi:hypothetical protein